MTNQKNSPYTPDTLIMAGFSEAIESAVNFRILKDGTLQKRCGFRPLFTFPTPIRAFWNGMLNGRYTCYALAGNTVYSVDLSSQEKTALGTIGTSEGDANFFCVQGSMYLTDGGSDVYLIKDDTLQSALGYVPLLGKDWDQNLMGEIYEPLNLLNRHARITYLVSATADYVKVPYQIDSIQAIYRNGTALSTNQYSINNDYLIIEIPGLRKNDVLEVCLTFPSSPKVASLLYLFGRMRSSIFFCHGEQSRTFFYNATDSAWMFCTRYVSTELLLEAQRHYHADPLYLPEGYEFLVGDGTYPVRSAIRHHDSLLIFTENDTWIVGEDATGLSLFPTHPVNAEIGCTTSHGCVLSPNDPITISRNGIYRWQSKDPELPQRDAVRIAKALDKILTPDDLQASSLLYDPREEELWVNVPTRNEIWISHLEQERWYCFTELGAEQLLNLDGTIGFLQGRKIFIMDTSYSFDLNAVDRRCPIVAVYESTPLFFFEKPKKLAHIYLTGKMKNAELHLDFILDQKRTVSYTMTDTDKTDHSFFHLRTCTERFRFTKLRITASNESCPEIEGMVLVAS